MRKGYLTVYLSLSLALILSFILTLVEGARVNTIRMEAECVADIGMNSVLAEFHRELLEQYDLFFVDMSYGTGNINIENTAGHLRHYMQKNFAGEKTETAWLQTRDWLSLSVDKVTISEFSIASDMNGNVMKRQAIEYMKESSVEGLLSKIISQAGELENFGIHTRDIEGERNQIQSQIEAIELPVEEDENGQQVEMTLDNPADKVNAYRGSLILGMVLGDTSDISKTVVRGSEYLSHRNRMSGKGINPAFQMPSGITDNLLFDCYLFEKCGRYGKELDKSLLKYQLEYILAGKDSDMENLETVVKRLLAWREAANVIYILSDSGKCAEAEALALTITAVLQVPALVQPVKYSILFAWAYIESLCDVKALLKGERVPIMKTAADWKTGIENIIDFAGETPSGGSETGLNYEDYLRIMLYLQDSTTKNMRAMDVMEMDIRQTYGNDRFQMDACFDSYLPVVSVSSGFGYHVEIGRRYGYH